MRYFFWRVYMIRLAVVFMICMNAVYNVLYILSFHYSGHPTCRLFLAVSETNSRG